MGGYSHLADRGVPASFLMGDIPSPGQDREYSPSERMQGLLPFQVRTRGIPLPRSGWDTPSQVRTGWDSHTAYRGLPPSQVRMEGIHSQVRIGGTPSQVRTGGTKSTPSTVGTGWGYTPPHQDWMGVHTVGTR